MLQTPRQYDHVNRATKLQEPHYKLTYVIRPGRYALWLLAALGILLLTHTAAMIVRFHFGYLYAGGLVPLFDIAKEGNLPTLFATFLIASNGLLFLTLRWLEGQGQLGRIWLLLACVFAFLAADEFARIHELLILPVRTALDLDGPLFFAWVVPYGIAVLVLAILVGPSLWRLGGEYRVLFTAAGGCYLLGAIGIEMLGGGYYSANNEQVDLTYRLYQTAEETLEFCGQILLSFTLLKLVQRHTLRIDIHA